MLTNVEIRNAKGRERSHKLSDSGGLFLLVSPTGNRSWRLKYHYGDKEKLLTFGSFPDISLSEARDRRDDAKRALREGVTLASKRRSHALSEPSAPIAHSRRLLAPIADRLTPAAVEPSARACATTIAPCPSISQPGPNMPGLPSDRYRPKRTRGRGGRPRLPASTKASAWGVLLKMPGKRPGTTVTAQCHAHLRSIERFADAKDC